MLSKGNFFNPSNKNAAKPLSRIISFLPIENSGEITYLLTLRGVNKGFKEAIDSRHFFFKPEKNISKVIFGQLKEVMSSKFLINREFRNDEIIEIFKLKISYLRNNLAWNNFAFMIGIGLIMIVLFRVLSLKQGIVLVENCLLTSHVLMVLLNY